MVPLYVRPGRIGGSPVRPGRIGGSPSALAVTSVITPLRNQALASHGTVSHHCYPKSDQKPQVKDSHLINNLS
jgi:hypothetical protein